MFCLLCPQIEHCATTPRASLFSYDSKASQPQLHNIRCPFSTLLNSNQLVIKSNRTRRSIGRFCAPATCYF